jgi:hypothetical protein
MIRPAQFLKWLSLAGILRILSNSPKVGQLGMKARIKIRLPFENSAFTIGD